MTEKIIKKMQAAGITAEKIAAIEEIDRIVYRAESALYNEISLAYDEAALADTREEREPYLERVRNCEAALNALISTTKNNISEIMEGKDAAEVPEFYKGIDELPDDEAIVNHLVYTEKGAKAELKRILAEILKEEFENDGDEQ